MPFWGLTYTPHNFFFDKNMALKFTSGHHLSIIHMWLFIPMPACLLKITKVDPFSEDIHGISNGKMHWNALIAHFCSV